MIEPNVLSYFLIIMAGFGTVWSFRLFTGRRDKKITEFEYAAFSTLWGIPVFMIFTWVLRDRLDILDTVLKLPLTATPSLFAIGVTVGAIGAWGMSILHHIWRKMGGKAW